MFHDGHQFAGELPGLLQYNEKITCGHRAHLTATVTQAQLIHSDI